MKWRAMQLQLDMNRHEIEHLNKQLNLPMPRLFQYSFLFNQFLFNYHGNKLKLMTAFNQCLFNLL